MAGQVTSSFAASGARRTLRWFRTRVALCLSATLLAFAGVTLAAGARAEAAPNVTVFGSAVNIRPDRALPAGGAAQGTLRAARNEFESFQVVVDGNGTAVGQLRVDRGAPFVQVDPAT